MSELYHYNHNHDPRNGRFASSGSGKVARKAQRKLNSLDVRKAEYKTNMDESYKVANARNNMRALAKKGATEYNKLEKAAMNRYYKNETKLKAAEQQTNDIIKSLDSDKYSVTAKDTVRVTVRDNGLYRTYRRYPGKRYKVSPK